DLKLPLVIGDSALSVSNRSEPITEELIDAPLYQLFNRLERYGLWWYENEKSIVVTSRSGFERHQPVVPYNLGDLLDQGYQAGDVIRALRLCTGNQLEKANLVGDVVFVRTTANMHFQISGLLAALRQHGRRTWTFDAAQNDAVRQALLAHID